MKRISRHTVIRSIGQCKPDAITARKTRRVIIFMFSWISMSCPCPAMTNFRSVARGSLFAKVLIINRPGRSWRVCRGGGSTTLFSAASTQNISSTGTMRPRLFLFSDTSRPRISDKGARLLALKVQAATYQRSYFVAQTVAAVRFCVEKAVDCVRVFTSALCKPNMCVCVCV